MQAYGGDRVRVVGERIILLSPITKGWTARVPKQATHPEHPGTAVLWEEQYFEVVSAEAAAGGVRYVLMAWRDEHTFRVFDAYDEATEARRVAEHKAVEKQRKGSVLASLSSMFLGHLPAQVQERLGNEYGITPARMTIASAFPALVLLGVCVWLYADARLRQAASPVPIWLWIVAVGLIGDAGVRFQVAMSQNRGMGSLPGAILYTLFWYLMPNRARFVSPFATEKGASTSFTIDPEEEIALRDALHLRAPLFTLLSVPEQQRLADRFGFEYRSHAYMPAIVILVCSALGAITSFDTLTSKGGLGSLLSLVISGGLALEQILRLRALGRGPAGSVLAFIVRPFVRGFLR
ncbi:MAG TPA: hypothetical protein VNA69_23710 [Thermoanaerobaculia bacterium]|nr:hypothetical protein [Thermoanaerobaculia bacterium]